MSVDKQKHAKVRLLVSNKNPIWSQLREMERRLQTDLTQLLKKSPPPGGFDSSLNGGSGDAGPRRRYLGVTDETMRQWRLHRGVASYTKVKSALAHLAHVFRLVENAAHAADDIVLARELGHRVTMFARVVDDEAVGLYAAASLLGLSVRETRLAMDDIFHSESPLLSLGYYKKDTKGNFAEADGHCTHLGGHYVMWLERKREGQTIIMQCAVSVPYVLAPIGQQHRIIRAKLMLPELNSPATDGSDAWVYDGFMRVVPPRVYWTFENRGTALQDFFYLITGNGNVLPSEEMTLDGHYMTCDQDGVAQSPVSGRAILRRIYSYRQTLDPADDTHRPDQSDELKRLAEGKMADLRAYAEHKLADDVGFAQRAELRKLPRSLSRGDKQFKQMDRIRSLIDRSAKR